MFTEWLVCTLRAVEAVAEAIRGACEDHGKAAQVDILQLLMTPCLMKALGFD